jgi:AcrR family transcriptional regulator
LFFDRTVDKRAVMPKIVDHARLRHELAGRAARLFLRRGYSTLGMREIAEGLGVSKSALYHYFPGKRALFDAAGQVAVARMASAFTVPSEAAAGPDAAVAAIMAGVRILDADFHDEVVLLTDYLRAVGPDEEARRGVARSNAMLRDAIAAIVGPGSAPLVQSLSYGFLLQRILAPEAADFARFETDLRDLLSSRAGSGAAPAGRNAGTAERR